MPPIDRRTYLGLAGTVLASGVAGCTRTSGDSPTDGTPGTTTNPSSTAERGDAADRALGDAYTPDGETTITLDRPRFERIVVGYYEPHYEIRSHPDWQFVVVDVDGEPPADFTAGWFGETSVYPTVDGERVPTPFPAQNVPTDDHNAVVPGLAVPFPVGEADSAAIVWDRDDGTTVSWSLPEDVRDGLSAVARFEVRSYAVTVDDDSVTGFHVRIANVGDRDGTFRGLMRIPDRDPDPIISVDVAAGGSESVSEIEEYATPGYVSEAYCTTDVPIELSPERRIDPTVTCR